MNAFQSAQRAYDSILPMDAPEDGIDIVLAYDLDEIAERLNTFAEAHYEIVLGEWMGSDQAALMGKDKAFDAFEKGESDMWLVNRLGEKKGLIWDAFETMFAKFEQEMLDGNDDEWEDEYEQAF